jgi:hypothetical protein
MLAFEPWFSPVCALARFSPQATIGRNGLLALFRPFHTPALAVRLPIILMGDAQRRYSRYRSVRDVLLVQA